MLRQVWVRRAALAVVAPQHQPTWPLTANDAHLDLDGRAVRCTVALALDFEIVLYLRGVAEVVGPPPASRDDRGVTCGHLKSANRHASSYPVTGALRPDFILLTLFTLGRIVFSSFPEGGGQS